MGLVLRSGKFCVQNCNNVSTQTETTLYFSPVYYSPAEMFMNRLELDSCFVKNAIKLDDNHMVIVYKQLEGLIERRIVQGPTIFIPTAYEWCEGVGWK